MKGKLGFGLMRLPRKGISIDIKETCEMIDMFMDRGFTYFDTAHIYPGSEVAAQKALLYHRDKALCPRCPHKENGRERVLREFEAHEDRLY